VWTFGKLSEARYALPTFVALECTASGGGFHDLAHVLAVGETRSQGLSSKRFLCCSISCCFDVLNFTQSLPLYDQPNCGVFPAQPSVHRGDRVAVCHPCFPATLDLGRELGQTRARVSSERGWVSWLGARAGNRPGLRGWAARDFSAAHSLVALTS
jgi:hypothetical protein